MEIRKTLCGTKLKLGMVISAMALAACLDGCAGPTPAPAAATSATTSTATKVTAATSSVPAVNPTFQKEFIAWAEACQGYALGAYGATSAIANNTIKPSAYPKIRDIIATTEPLCHTYPTNPQQIDTQIIEATAALAESIQSNQINASTAPTTSTGAK